MNRSRRGELEQERPEERERERERVEVRDGARSDVARGRLMIPDTIPLWELLLPENNPEPLAKSAPSFGWICPPVVPIFPDLRQNQRDFLDSCRFQEKKYRFRTETSMPLRFHTKIGIFRAYEYVQRMFSHKRRAF